MMKATKEQIYSAVLEKMYTGLYEIVWCDEHKGLYVIKMKGVRSCYHVILGECMEMVFNTLKEAKAFIALR